MLVAGCHAASDPGGTTSIFASFAGTWTDGPIPTFHPDQLLEQSSPGTWVRIDLDGGVRLGSTYVYSRGNGDSFRYADEREGRLIISDAGAHIVWDWEDIYTAHEFVHSPCLFLAVDSVQWSPGRPDASVLAEPIRATTLTDGGLALTLHIEVDYGSGGTVLGSLDRVEDTGEETLTTLETISGTWSNGLYTDLEVADGGPTRPLPWGDRCCAQTLIAISPDGGARQRILTYWESAPETSSYVLQVATGRIEFDGRRLLFRDFWQTSTEFEMSLDGGTTVTGSDAGPFPDGEERAYFARDAGSLDALWISDVPRAPLLRISR